MALPAKKPQYTFADVLTWNEDERVEIIDGEVIMMGPAPARVHQKVSGELFAQLHAYLKGKKCKVYSAPFDVRLFEEDGDRPEDVDTVVEPDITVVCDSSKLDDRGCKGAPDMVVEILSPATQRHDRFTKFSLYQRVGVREYWLVDPDSKTVQSFILEDGRYSVKEFGATGNKMKVYVLEDCVIDLSEIFPEMTIKCGRWSAKPLVPQRPQYSVTMGQRGHPAAYRHSEPVQCPRYLLCSR